MELIPRPSYQSVLTQYKDSPQIKVLSGVRRCGKSTLLEMLFRTLVKTTPPENLLFLRCDSTDVPLAPTAEWLDNRIQQVLKSSNSDSKVYFLLDEIQEIPAWEKVVRRLHSDPRADVYVTGSNAHLLSSDLATYLAGR